jgi:hypothetical protein
MLNDDLQKRTRFSEISAESPSRICGHQRHLRRFPSVGGAQPANHRRCVVRSSAARAGGEVHSFTAKTATAPPLAA